MLSKPQVPTVVTRKDPTDWKGMQMGLASGNASHQDLSRYLQGYLGKMYQAIVPLQYSVTTFGHSASPYTPTQTDSLLAAAASASADTTIDLPVATGSGRAFIIVKTDSNAHNIVITPNGSDTISGSASETLSSQYQATEIVDTATGLWIKLF